MLLLSVEPIRAANHVNTIVFPQCQIRAEIFMGETPKKIVEVNSCFLCSVEVVKNDKMFIFGKSSSNFTAVIKSCLDVDASSLYSDSSELFVCKAKCYGKLTKYKTDRIQTSDGQCF